MFKKRLEEKGFALRVCTLTFGLEFLKREEYNNVEPKGGAVLYTCTHHQSTINYSRCVVILLVNVIAAVLIDGRRTSVHL